MKNALDWLVSGVEFPGKPIMLVNTSPRATHAQESLREVLCTMSGVIVDEACVEVPLLGTCLNTVGILQHESIAGNLLGSLNKFCNYIRSSNV